MTTRSFDAHAPLAVDVLLAGGTLTVSASDTDVAVVTIEPADPQREADRRAADETGVEHDGNRLMIRAPRRKGLRWLGPGPGPALRVLVDVPTGSSLSFGGFADLDVSGRLGAVDVVTAMGDVTVEHGEAVRVKSSFGEIAVGTSVHEAELTSSAGGIRLARAEGPARLRTSAGDLRLGETQRSAQLRTSSGDVRIGSVSGTLEARTAAGDITVDRAVEGSLRLDTSYGGLDVGVPEGTAAWLDTEDVRGRVTSDLPAAQGAHEGDRVVEVRARSAYGSFHVRRAGGDDPTAGGQSSGPFEEDS